jgi:hypothetical protein
VREHILDKAIQGSFTWEHLGNGPRTENGTEPGTSPNEDLKVFFCFDPAFWPHRENINEIVWDLSQRGVTCWLEDRSVRAGEDLILKKREAIAAHRIGIVAVGSNKLSASVQKDCIMLKAKNYRLIPVILPGSSSKLELPNILRGYAAVDFRVLGTKPYDRLAEGIAAAAKEVNDTSRPPQQAGHVFLSYCREDERAVRRIYSELTDAEHEVWWDQRLKPGEDWRAGIHSAIQKAYAVLVFFSKATQEREESGVFPELSEAIELYRRLSPKSAPFLIPVRLSDCDVPDLFLGEASWFNTLQRLDLFGRRRGLAFAELLKTLNTARQRRG